MATIYIDRGEGHTLLFTLKENEEIVLEDDILVVTQEGITIETILISKGDRIRVTR